MGRRRIDIAGKTFYSGRFTAKLYDESLQKWKVLCYRQHTFYATYSDINRGRLNLCAQCRDLDSIESPIKNLYASYKRSAELRGHSFELDLMHFKILIGLDCGYCGSPPSQVYKKPGAKYDLTYNGIDRVNNSIGYNQNNCITACKFCNFAKGKASYEEFTVWLEQVAKFRNAIPTFYPNGAI